MEAPSSKPDVLDILRNDRDLFWLERSNLPEDQIQKEWSDHASRYFAILFGGEGSSKAAAPLQKSTSQDPRRSSYQAPKPASHAPMMARNRTDHSVMLNRSHSLSQHGQTHSRKRSSSSSTRPSPFKTNKPIPPPMMVSQSLGNEHVLSNGSPASPAKMQCTDSRSRAQLRNIPEIIEYDVNDYLANMNGSETTTTSRSIPAPRNAQLNAVGRVPPSPALSASLSSSFDSSQPTTPFQSGFGGQQHGQSSQGMSRASSLGGQFYATFNNQMNMRQLSEASDHLVGGEQTPPITSQPRHDHSPQRSSHQDLLSENYNNVSFSQSDSSLLLSYNGTTAATSFQDTSQYSDENHVQVHSSDSQSAFPVDVEEEMGQDNFQTSDDGTASPSSQQTRSARRLQTQLQSSTRTLAPKVIKEENRSKSSLARLQNSTTSSNGNTTPEKCAIPKSTYTRPQREKVKCTQCDEQPEGFRGEHELRRHTERAHKKVRKVWICIEGYEDGKLMLSGCKQCRNRKPYGAYYNAAAHLRRVHFNPKPKGRRARGQGKSDRAGHGGGDQPPMEWLKSKWMKEVDETVQDKDEIEDGLDPEADEDIEDDTEMAEDPNIKYKGESSDEEDKSFLVPELAPAHNSATYFPASAPAARMAAPSTLPKQHIIPAQTFDPATFSDYSLAASTTPKARSVFGSDVPRNTQMLIPDGFENGDNAFSMTHEMPEGMPGGWEHTYDDFGGLFDFEQHTAGGNNYQR